MLESWMVTSNLPVGVQAVVGPFRHGLRAGLFAYFRRSARVFYETSRPCGGARLTRGFRRGLAGRPLPAAEDRGELRTALERLFASVAPELRIYPEGEVPPPLPGADYEGAQGEGKVPVFWQHVGLGLDGGPGSFELRNGRGIVIHDLSEPATPSQSRPLHLS